MCPLGTTPREEGARDLACVSSAKRKLNRFHISSYHSSSQDNRGRNAWASQRSIYRGALETIGHAWVGQRELSTALCWNLWREYNSRILRGISHPFDYCLCIIVSDVNAWTVDTENRTTTSRTNEEWEDLIAFGETSVDRVALIEEGSLAGKQQIRTMKQHRCEPHTHLGGQLASYFVRHIYIYVNYVMDS